MIPLEKQVTSLELSKRLKELEVKQDSYWVWVHPFLAKDLEHFYDEDNKLWKLIPRQSLAPARVIRHIFAAFTVAELGEILPQYAESYRIATNQFSCKFCELIEDIKGNPQNGRKHIKVAHTEADARAKMLIYLIENKLMGANK